MSSSLQYQTTHVPHYEGETLKDQYGDVRRNFSSTNDKASGLAGKERASDHGTIQGTVQQVTLSERINHVTWAWFTFPMSTGGLALLLANQGHQFPGLMTIGRVVYVVNLVIFVAVTAMIGIRFSRDYRRFLRSLKHDTESLFFPAFFIALASIIAGMWLYGRDSTGPWLGVTVRVLFWIYVAVSFLVATGQYWLLFLGVQFTIQSMTPGWLLPFFPYMLSGTVAASIADSQPPAQRLPIHVAGLTAQGLGFFLALVFYALYLGRLMQSGLPHPNLRPGMFIAVGPPSFTGLVLIGLTRSLQPYYGYFQQNPQAVEILRVMALATAIFVWSLSMFFFAIALASVLHGVRRMRFSLIWYAFIFPNVGFTIDIIYIGQELGSVAVTWVGSALTLVLWALYFVVLAAHVHAVWTGAIMWPGKDEDKEE